MDPAPRPIANGDRQELQKVESTEKKESQAIANQFPEIYQQFTRAIEKCSKDIQEQNIKCKGLQQGVRYFVYKHSDKFAIGTVITGLAAMGFGFHDFLTIPLYYVFLREKGIDIDDEVAKILKNNNISDTDFTIYKEYYLNLSNSYEEQYLSEYRQMYSNRKDQTIGSLVTGCLATVGGAIACFNSTTITEWILRTDFTAQFIAIHKTKNELTEKQKKINELYQWGIKVAKFCKAWEKYQKDSTSVSKLKLRYQQLVEGRQNHQPFLKLSQALVDNDLVCSKGIDENEMTLAELLSKRKNSKDIVLEAFKEEVAELLDETEELAGFEEIDTLLDQQHISI